MIPHSKPSASAATAAFPAVDATVLPVTKLPIDVCLPSVNRYRILPSVLASLEPTEVGTIFRHVQDPHRFFPAWGLFATEFALAYCHNLHCKRHR